MTHINELRRRAAIVALVLTLGLFAAACGGGTPSVADELPPAESLPELEFGRGELPITVPSNWPMPEQHTIAGTMIDGSRTLTEVVYTAGGELLSVVASYERALPEAGYEFETIKESDTRYRISFEGNGIKGELALAPAGHQVTTATLTFVYA
ncbi:MAG: hypothetical protein KDB69_05565 [Acidimicrobiia bacterium]|nr:hypothetical protein [Acidimicrobiia bacterium]